MSSNDETLRSLREALRASPNNLPLRKHIAEMLARWGRFEEAEAEYRDAIRLAPDDPSLKLELAACFFEQGKNSESLVIVEDLIKSLAQQPQAHAQALLLHARLLARAGHRDRASHQYRKAVELDPDTADEAFAESIGAAAADVWRDDQNERVPVPREGGGPGGPTIELERPKLDFEAVGGMEKLKDEIRLKIIHPLEHPELYEAYGKKIGGGILLYGPPGCGKTYLARATAGQVKAAFICVGIHDVLDMWIGSSEKQLHEIFDQARRNRPCVLFFDEVDALGASRSDLRHTAGRTLINQFLAELDGMQANNEGVLILGATNAPWHLDSAFRRPGRFDRVLFVPPPDAEARAQILRIMLKGKPTEAVDHDHIARKAEGFSGADIKAIVDLAIEDKLREAVKKGVPTPLTSKDLLASAKQVKPSTKDWFATARNYALYSNQGGVYDDILDFLRLK